MRTFWSVVVVWMVGCHPDENLSTQQMVERTRQATPRCLAGDAESCKVACKFGGPNRSCARACDAGDGPGCMKLAARLEREVDAPDAETPPRPIDPPDDEQITELYERACQLEVGQGCRSAGGRILNGQGRGKRPPSAVTDLLRRGCKQLGDAESCCMMAHLNHRLAMSPAAARAGVNFAEEARKWTLDAEDRGRPCPPPAPGGP